MANSFNGSLVNPEYAEAGSRATASLFSGYGNALNVAHARGGNSVLVSQSYPDDLAHVRGHANAILGTNMAAPAFEWRIPIVDDKRTCEIAWFVSRTESPFDAGKSADIVVSSSVDTVTLTINQNGIAEYTGSLTVDASGTYETISVLFNCDVGASFAIHTITMWYDVLASPVGSGYAKQPDDARGNSHRFAAIGSSQMGTGKPISAVIGKNLIDNCNALDKRVETGIVWCGLRFMENADTNTGYGDRWYDEATPVLVRARDGESKYTFHVQATNPTPAAVDFVVSVTGGRFRSHDWPRSHGFIEIGDESYPETTHTFTAAASTDHAWYTFTTTLTRFSRPIGMVNPDRAVQVGVVSSYNSEIKSTGDNPTTLGQMGNPPAGDPLGGRPYINALSVWSVP